MALDHRTVWILMSLAVGVLAGGTVTIGGLKIDFPGAGLIKNYVVSDKDIVDRLSRYKSYHATVVFSATRKPGQEFLEATVAEAGSHAHEFFGFAADAGALREKNIGELLQTLQPWMTNFADFARDQSEVSKAYLKGLPAIAKVPVRFNGTHRFEEFRNKTYYPIIVQLTGEQKSANETREYLTVLYLDIGTMPRDLFFSSSTAGQVISGGERSTAMPEAHNGLSG